jgi:hypothetical protein
MIDTIVLSIPKSRIARPTSSPGWDLYASTSNYDKFVKNPTKREKDTGLYFPRLSGYKRKGYANEELVRIEFSVPKILYGNNLQELEDTDFGTIVDLLYDRLLAMDVLVDKETLVTASVSTVHFSKNILLQDGYTAKHVISELAKVNIWKTFDFAKARYINDGESLCAHTSSHELVVYDKVADMRKGSKRAIDRDQTAYQQSLFDGIPKKELCEILRLEIRLTAKTKLNSVLQELGYDKNPRFFEVFSTKMSQKVVSYYWNRYLKEAALGTFAISSNPKDILRLLLTSKVPPKEAIYLTGLVSLSRDGNGLRELRSMIAKVSADRTWYRTANDLKKANTLLESIQRPRGWVVHIDRSLEEYSPIDLPLAHMISK